MVKLSWFSNVIHNHKPKKIIQQAGESVQNSYPIYSLDQEIRFSRLYSSSSMKTDENESLENQTKQLSDKYLEDNCKTDNYSGESREFMLDAQHNLVQQANIKKTKSLGYIGPRERCSGYDDGVQEDAFSSHENQQINNMGDPNLAEGNKSEFQNVSCGKSARCKSLFAIGEVEQSDSDEEHHEYADDESHEHVSYGQMPSNNDPLHVKLCSSVANLMNISDGSPKLELMRSQSRSCENLFYNNVEVALDRGKDALDAQHESNQDEWGSTCIQSQLVSNNSVGCCELSDPEKDGKNALKKSVSEIQLVDSLGYNHLDDLERGVKYWSKKDKRGDKKSITRNDPRGTCADEIVPVEPRTDDAITFVLKEGTFKNWDGSNPQECNNSRVAAWVSQLDVGNCNIVEELGESSSYRPHKEPPKIAESVISKKHDARCSVGMLVAYNYLSTLSPTSSTALMSNLALVAIPSFNGFAGLKMLNLSGNAIVRITAGALPKGLHMLNLSKNHISVIEGLRELTRLRVLDLNYNKITRIGHGLASCSMLRELYLAGNKISEIDGLYRLLKLSILDLRCNRISNTKGVEQLAANYASLQAINLEGNPAQKNVGDEHLKKHLLSLLPNLTHYNKHAVRATGSKEVLDGPTRSFSSQQFDRSFRSGHRGACHRVASHGHLKNATSSSIKSSRSSKYKPLVHALPKPSNHPPIAGRILDSPQPRSSLRRIQSENLFSRA